MVCYGNSTLLHVLELTQYYPDKELCFVPFGQLLEREREAQKGFLRLSTARYRASVLKCKASLCCEETKNSAMMCNLGLLSMMPGILFWYSRSELWCTEGLNLRSLKRKITFGQRGRCRWLLPNHYITIVCSLTIFH